jgi:hypothetical protein
MTDPDIAEILRLVRAIKDELDEVKREVHQIKSEMP